MFRFLKNIFPDQAKSLKEFLELCQQGQCSEVKIGPHICGSVPLTIIQLGRLPGTYRCVLHYAAVSSTGRGVVFTEKLYKIYSRQWDLATAGRLREELVKLFLLCEQRQKELQATYGNTKINLLFDGKPMSESRHQDIHATAERLGVTFDPEFSALPA